MTQPFINIIHRQLDGLFDHWDTAAPHDQLINKAKLIESVQIDKATSAFLKKCMKIRLTLLTVNPITFKKAKQLKFTVNLDDIIIEPGLNLSKECFSTFEKKKFMEKFNEKLFDYLQPVLNSPHNETSDTSFMIFKLKKKLKPVLEIDSLTRNHLSNIFKTIDNTINNELIDPPYKYLIDNDYFVNRSMRPAKDILFNEEIIEKIPESKSNRIDIHDFIDNDFIQLDEEFTVSSPLITNTSINKFSHFKISNDDMLLPSNKISSMSFETNFESIYTTEWNCNNLASTSIDIARLKQIKEQLVSESLDSSFVYKLRLPVLELDDESSKSFCDIVLQEKKLIDQITMSWNLSRIKLLNLNWVPFRISDKKVIVSDHNDTTTDKVLSQIRHEMVAERINIELNIIKLTEVFLLPSDELKSDYEIPKLPDPIRSEEEVDVASILNEIITTDNEPSTMTNDQNLLRNDDALDSLIATKNETIKFSETEFIENQTHLNLENELDKLILMKKESNKEKSNKRTNLDFSEFDSFIQSKKNKPNSAKVRVTDDYSKYPFLELLLFNKSKVNEPVLEKPEEVIDTSQNLINNDTLEDTNSFSKSDFAKLSGMNILMNESLIETNYQLLNALKVHVNVLETNLFNGEKDVNFCIDESTGIGVIGCEFISQKKLDGTYTITEKIMIMKQNTKELFIVIKVNDNFFKYDKNIIDWQNICYMMSKLNISIISSTTSLESVKNCIFKIILHTNEKNANVVFVSPDQIIDKTEEENFLSECGLNFFQYKVILSKCSLREFILMKFERKCELFSYFLTKYSLVCIIFLS